MLQTKKNTVEGLNTLYLYTLNKRYINIMRLEVKNILYTTSLRHIAILDNENNIPDKIIVLNPPYTGSINIGDRKLKTIIGIRKPRYNIVIFIVSSMISVKKLDPYPTAYKTTPDK